jgi:hypothetical protein
MEMHSESDIASHKVNQEYAMTSKLTAEHHANIHRELAALRLRLEQMAHQLYVQSVLTFDLIARVLRHSTVYYAQRIPRELWHLLMGSRWKGTLAGHSLGGLVVNGGDANTPIQIHAGTHGTLGGS